MCHPKQGSAAAAAVLATVVLAACGGAASQPGATVPGTAGIPATATIVTAPPETAPPATPASDLAFTTAGWKTDFSRHTVALEEIRSGGPGKDGIPAIDEPSFEPVTQASEWLDAREPVIQLELGDGARAYPLQILIWHEIVNDELAGVPVAVTFCPLCNTVLVFDRRLDGRELTFGTTGNLRNSDLVMYDRQTESWWQQFGGDAIVGQLAGAELELVPARIVAWEDFVSAHPDGEVLSRPDEMRPYGENPYVGYDSVDSPPIFPAEHADDDRLAPKERVVYVQRGEEAAAVPFATLEAAGSIELELAGESLTVRFVPGAASALDDALIRNGKVVGSAEVTDAAGEPVPFDTPFWFAVAAFRPEVEIVEP